MSLELMEAPGVGATAARTLETLKKLGLDPAMRQGRQPLQTINENSAAAVRERLLHIAEERFYDDDASSIPSTEASVR